MVVAAAIDVGALIRWSFALQGNGVCNGIDAALVYRGAGWLDTQDARRCLWGVVGGGGPQLGGRSRWVGGTLFHHHAAPVEEYEYEYVRVLIQYRTHTHTYIYI